LSLSIVIGNEHIELITEQFFTIPAFYHVISAGAHGYLLKDDSDTELLTAIHTVRKGKTYVSPQLVTEVTGDMVSAFRHGLSLLGP